MSRFSRMKPWQAKQLVVPMTDAHGKPFHADSLVTRQRKRQAFRLIAEKKVNEQWGPEPRAARRKIARALAKTAFLEHRKTT